MRELYYLEKYSRSESVNRILHYKKGHVLVTVNNTFLDKLTLDIAIDKLPPKYRAVLLLYYKYTFPVQEISEILGVHRNTVANRIKKAKEMLRNA